MSNRACLLNTAVLTSDANALEAKSEESGNDYIEVAFASYRIPVPWLCCFRPEDLRIVQVELGSEEGDEPRYLPVPLPCTTVGQAIVNLEASLPLFITLAGSEALGRDFWQDVIDGLRSLPLPYLTLDVLEVMFGNEVEEFIALMTAAMGGDEKASECLKILSFYEDGIKPYPLDILNSGVDNADPARITNCVALDAGIVDPDDYTLHLSPGSSLRRECSAAGKAVAPRGADSLGKLCGEVTALVNATQESAFGGLAFAPLPRSRLEAFPRVLKWLSFGARAEQRQEVLKLLIIAQTDAERDQLASDPALRVALDGALHARFETVCRDLGIGWSAHVIESSETIARDFRGQWPRWYASLKFQVLG